MSPRSKQPPQEQARKILVEASPLAARLLLEALQEEELTPRRMKSLVNRIKSTLSECGPKHIYSAVLSTHILYESPVMRKLEERLQALDQWDEELEAIRRELESIALPSPD